MTIGTGRMFDPRPAPYFAIPKTTPSEASKNERSMRRIIRDARCRNDEPYTLREFTIDLLENLDIDPENFQLRVDAVSKTEGLSFEDAREVGDAVLEELKSWGLGPFHVKDVNHKVLEMTGLDTLLDS